MQSICKFLNHSDAERSLFSLSIRLGGLGIGNPKLLSDSQFDSSVKITSALVALIVQQESHFSIDTLEAQRLAKSEVVLATHQAQADFAASLHQSSWFKSFLTGRRQYVKINGVLSSLLYYYYYIVLSTELRLSIICTNLQFCS